MPKPYLYDLRHKVIESIELDAINKSEAAKRQLLYLGFLQVKQLPHLCGSTAFF